jgi:hypothetical protein
MKNKISRLNSKKRKKTNGPEKNATEAKSTEAWWVSPSDDDSGRPNGACCDDEGYRRRATSSEALNVRNKDLSPFFFLLYVYAKRQKCLQRRRMPQRLQ